MIHYHLEISSNTSDIGWSANIHGRHVYCLPSSGGMTPGWGCICARVTNVGGNNPSRPSHVPHHHSPVLFGAATMRDSLMKDSWDSVCCPVNAYLAMYIAFPPPGGMTGMLFIINNDIFLFGNNVVCANRFKKKDFKNEMWLIIISSNSTSSGQLYLFCFS